MSTNGVIARKTSAGFTGRYHHWDSYPNGLGQSLVELFHGHFQRDLSAMLRVLLDEHNGWSTIVNKDFSVKPGYVDQAKLPSRPYPSEFKTEAAYKKAQAKYERNKNVRRPQCYCHGERSEQNPPVTQREIMEWAYVFDEARATLEVFYGDRKAWHSAGKIDLVSDEPCNINWTAIECGENLERCHHVARYHFPELKDSPSGALGTPTYLGYEPLNTTDFHEAKSVIVNGRRWTVGGGHSAPGNFDRTGYKGAPAWIASLSDGDDQIEVPVALVTSTGYKPFKGVMWVFPPTAVNRQETLVKGA